MTSTMDSDSDPDLIARHYNYTGKFRSAPPSRDDAATDTSVTAALRADSAIFLAVCCLIVLENALVLVTIWRTSRFHKPMYYFIGNLALSDLLAGLVYAANILLSGANTLRLTPAQWFVREGSMFVALGASVFSLLAIALERHLTMRHMKLHHSSSGGGGGGRGGCGNSWRVFVLISAVWLVAAVLGLLPAMGWNCIQQLPRCSTVLPLYHKAYIFFCTSVFSALLLAIVVLYARIYRLVRARSGGGAPSRSSEKSLALLKTVIIVLGCFIACWAPLFVLLLLDAACGVRRCPVLYRAEWFLALAVLNSAMNPLIYTLTSHEMRRAFLQTLLCCTSWLRPPWGAKPASRTGSGTVLEFSRSRSQTSSRPSREEGHRGATSCSSSGDLDVSSS